MSSESRPSPGNPGKTPGAGREAPQPWEPSDSRIPAGFLHWSQWPSLYPEERRTVPHESLTRYLEGGYHPTSIGDVLGSGRYQIRHKLGFGANSIVWLAEDLRPDQDETCRRTAESTTLKAKRQSFIRARGQALGEQDPKVSRWVALKIKTADSSAKDPSEDPEVKACRLLNLFVNEHESETDVLPHGQVLDYFALTGPNGHHLCLVLEFLGPTIWDVVSACNAFEDTIRPDTILRTTRQLLRAVDVAHSAGVSHGNISFADVVFTCHEFLDNFHYSASSGSDSDSDSSSDKPAGRSLAATETKGEEAKSDATASSSSLYETLGGPPDVAPYLSDEHPRPSFLPQQIAKTATWAAWVDKPAEDIRIIDWELTFPISESVSKDKLAQPIDLRYPETFFLDTVDYRGDLWRVGCVIYILFYQQPPFPYPYGSDPRIIQLMMSKLGPLPESWQAQYDAMVREEEARQQQQQKEHKPTELAYPPRLITKTFEPRRRKMSDAVPIEEADEFRTYDLDCLKCLLPIMQGLLRWNPDERITAKEGLELLEWIDHRREI